MCCSNFLVGFVEVLPSIPFSAQILPSFIKLQSDKGTSPLDDNTAETKPGRNHKLIVNKS